MTYDMVMQTFKSEFPDFAKKIETCFPNGRNSIIIRLNTKEEYVFSIFGNEWEFKTYRKGESR